MLKNSKTGATAWDYGDAIFAELVALRRDVQATRGNDPVFRRIPFKIDTDGAGNGSTKIDKPRGFRWDLIAWALPGSLQIDVYANEVHPSMLIDSRQSLETAGGPSFADNEQLTSDDTGIVFNVTSGGNNTTIYGNFRVLQYEESPNEPLNAN